MKAYIEHLSSLSAKQLVLMLAKQKQAQTAPIAVLGTGCRLPGNVNSLNALWQTLINGQVQTKHYQQGPPGPYSQPRWPALKLGAGSSLTTGAYLEHLDQATNPLNLDEQELLYMDPQQRLLLDCTLDALYQAGLTKDSLKGQKVGVFIGISAAEYLYAGVNNGLSEQDLSAYMGTGVAHSAAPGRIAMLLQSQGPTLAIDSACSSALSALHQAKNALRSGDCDYAIVGASHLLLSPYTSMVFDKANMLSKQGCAKVFDSEADGHVRGEGVGVLLLTRKDIANQNANKPLAWIKGSAIHQQGQRPAMSVSTGTSQRQVIASALEDGMLSVDDIDYVEAHATGAKLGAQVEVENLAMAYQRDLPLYIGSAKANFGHLEAASGIVSLLKAIAVVQKRQIPAQANLNELAAEISASKGHLDIATDNIAIDKQDMLHCAISSFGFTGTNAHAIIASGDEQAPFDKHRTPDASTSIWPEHNLWS